MFKVSGTTIRTLVVASVLLAGSMAAGLPTTAAAEVVVLRSGNAPVGNPDPQINLLAGTGGTPLSALPFTAADFAAACGGRSAIVINPHPAWLQQLSCDPLARWIGVDPFGTPTSALYCQPFDVKACCIHSATLNFCWAGDDALGDGIYGGPNLDGVYINGVPVAPSINTGSYAAQTQVGGVDVTALLHCGTNYLQIYNRDAAYTISGIIYHGVIDITECVVPTLPATIGQVKAHYR